MEAFLGEIRMLHVDYAPDGWLPCDGRTLKVAEHPAIFALIFNTYGGDGKTTFCLPDLRGLAAMGSGTGSDGTVSREATPGKRMGTPSVELSLDEMPVHTHQARGHQVLANGSAGPTNTSYVSIPRMGSTAYDAWTPHLPGGPSETMLSERTVGIAGGTSRTGAAEPHENRSPYLALTFCICLNGIFPSRP